MADVETIDRSIRNARSVWGQHRRTVPLDGYVGLTGYAAVMERLFPKLSRETEVPRRCAT